MIKEISVRLVDSLRQDKDRKKHFTEAIRVNWIAIVAGAAIGMLCWGVPLIGIAVWLLISAGVKAYYVGAYGGKYDETTVWSIVKRARGILPIMLKYGFFVGIWSLIPVVGVVISVVKSYQYRFVPYILSGDGKDAKNALKTSREMTTGFCLELFLLDVLLMLPFVIVTGVLALLALIPVIGIFFGITCGLVAVCFAAVLPIARGYAFAACYTEIKEKNVHPRAKAVYCKFCMSKMDPGCLYCSNCGEKLTAEDGKAG
ncbi:MAG: hypothetical protein J6L92_01875 [Clostridia bacterium]|nr:hypothetical protein [Clostridia bacterium]